MLAPGGPLDEDKPIGALFGQLVDEGKAFARAEIGLVKAQAEVKAASYKLPAILFGAALLFVIAGVVALVLTVAAALATIIGPLAGGLIAVIAAFAVAGGLAMAAVRKLKP